MINIYKKILHNYIEESASGAIVGGVLGSFLGPLGAAAGSVSAHLAQNALRKRALEKKKKEQEQKFKKEK